MKDKFKGYYRLDENGFSILWKNALFIFDTNVLLNLYRYQSSTRDELLKVLDLLKGRVWIPNQTHLQKSEIVFNLKFEIRNFRYLQQYSG